MANYLTSFNNLAEYQAATLDIPNVSLIKSDGSVLYKNLFAGALLGDILMWDVENQKLITTYGGNWDATTYPIAQYEPIAVNIYPAEQAADGKARYMALKWASNTSDNGSAFSVGLKWGLNSASASFITSDDQNTLNGRENTNKALALADGTTANTRDAFAAFAAVNRFKTNGTNQGDWYLPSKAELSLYQANYNDINEKITAIKNASSSIVSTVKDTQWASTEYNSNTNNSWYLLSSGSWSGGDRGTGLYVRGVVSL